MFVLLFTLLGSLYIDTKLTPNPVSRALPALAWVHQGTWAINAYHTLTIDKAFIAGFYYTDKAPLSSWLTTGGYWLAHKFGMTNGLTVAERLQLAVLIGAWLCGTLPFLWLLVALFLIVQARGLTLSRSWALAIMFGFGTYLPS
ncbi:MAG: hypothetical protein JW841_11050 [Deltaproteobacteria bacterium]|nr:hypothetical protein [Deltaproteobacteria bacterium]